MVRSVRLTRRTVVALLAGTGTWTLLAACAQPAPTPTTAPKPAAPTPAPAAPATKAPEPAKAAEPAKPAEKPAAPAAAAPAPAAATGEITYLHFGPSPQEMQLVPPVVADFQSRNPRLKVNYVHVPAGGGGDAWQQKISTLMAAGTPPDSSQFENTFYDDWVSRNVLLDLSPYIQRDKMDLRQFLDEEVRYYDREGKRYAIGYSENGLAVFFNRDIFQKAGLAPPPAKVEEIWTWEKFLDASLKLTLDDKGRHSGQAGFDSKNVKQWGANWLHGYNWLFPLSVGALGGQDPISRQPDGSIKIALDNPNVIQAYQGVTDLQHKHFADPKADAMKEMGISAVQMFMTGRLGMWVTGTWAILQLNADKAFKYGVGIIPRMQQPAGWINTDSIVTFRASKNPDGSWEWIKYWVGEEVQARLSGAGIWMPTLKSLVTPEGAKKWLKPEIQPAEFQTAVLDFNSRYARAEYAPPGFPEMVSKLYGPGLDPLWTTYKEPDAAKVLPEVAKNINAFYAEKAKTK